MPRILALTAVLLTPAAAAAPDGEAPEGHGPHAAHGWHAALFAGAVHSGGHSALALGADLELALGHGFGAALLADVVLGAHPHGFVAPALVVHPGLGFRFVAAPGVALSEDHHHGLTAHFAARVAAGYDVHAGAFTVTPLLHADVAQEVTFGAGVSVGIGF